MQRHDLSQLPQSILLLLIRAAHTRQGAARIIQSPLLRALESEFSLVESDRDALTMLSLLLKLTVTLVAHHGHTAHEFAFRLVVAHWDELHAAVEDGCARLSRSVASAEDCGRIGLQLELGRALLDIAWHLQPVRGTWALHWPGQLVTQLEQLAQRCTNYVAAVLARPHSLFAPQSAFIVQGKAARQPKRVSFLPMSPSLKLEHHQQPAPSFDDIVEPAAHRAMGLAPSRLESVLYHLLHIALLTLSRSTFIATDNCIYEVLIG